MNTLPFEIESELEVQYAILHPQLCGQGGNEILTEILQQSAGEPDTYVVSGACAPEAQAKLFRKVLRNSGFDEKRFLAVDIRGTDNEGILSQPWAGMASREATSSCTLPWVEILVAAHSQRVAREER